MWCLIFEATHILSNIKLHKGVWLMLLIKLPKAEACRAVWSNLQTYLHMWNMFHQAHVWCFMLDSECLVLLYIADRSCERFHPQIMFQYFRRWTSHYWLWLHFANIVNYAYCQYYILQISIVLPFLFIFFIFYSL